MTLPSSGPISMYDINVELGRPGTQNLSLNDTQARQLAGVPSGTISLSDFYGKSWTVTGYVFAIGGGGGGGNDAGAGGGGGGSAFGTGTLSRNTSYTVYVGGGGSPGGRGSAGGNSYLDGVYSLGGGASGGGTVFEGGGGGGGFLTNINGANGGKGGDGTRSGGNPDGANGYQSGNATSAGGGCGTYDIFGTSIAGGGGAGGGGYAGAGANFVLGGDGSVYGGGGGGGKNYGGSGGYGAAGITIVYYDSPTQAFGGGSVQFNGTTWIHTFYSTGTLYPI
jgi:hypothetical protein